MHTFHCPGGLIQRIGVKMLQTCAIPGKSLLVTRAASAVKAPTYWKLVQRLATRHARQHAVADNDSETSTSYGSTGPRASATNGVEQRGMDASSMKTLATYKVLLAITWKLLQSDDGRQLDAFLRARPEATAMPFLLWLAEEESRADGEEKQKLAQLCEKLVMFREQLDTEAMDNLYLSTLDQIAASSCEATALAVRDNPEQYAIALAEQVTGSPIQRQGFDPVYDMVLQVAPPAALTPEGIKRGHEQAKELAEDMRQRRKRSITSIIGRAQLTPQQADQLMAGTAASRILDMLLTLPSTSDRLNCLPDCFTPPEPRPYTPLEPAAAAAVAAAAATAGEQPTNDVNADEELLWCTPLQLFNELESRLIAITQSMGARGGPPARALLPAGGQASVKGEALVLELQALRDAIKQMWLASMPDVQANAAGSQTHA